MKVELGKLQKGPHIEEKEQPEVTPTGNSYNMTIYNIWDLLGITT